MFRTYLIESTGSDTMQLWFLCLADEEILRAAIDGSQNRQLGLPNSLGRESVYSQVILLLWFSK